MQGGRSYAMPALRAARNNKANLLKIKKEKNAYHDTTKVRGHHEDTKSLQLRVSKAVNRNRSLARLCGEFTVLKRGLLGDSEEQCWAVLDTQLGSLSLYDSNPDEENENVAPANVGFFESAMNQWSQYARQSRRRPKLLGESLMKSVTQSLDAAVCQPAKMPFKTFELTSLRGCDSNPNFCSLFLYFKGKDDVRLTASCDDDFQDWLQALEHYDVFVRSVSLDGQPKMKNVPAFRASSNLGEIMKPGHEAWTIAQID